MGYASQKFATPQEFEKWLEDNEHENKAELDKICGGKTEEWDSKVCHAELVNDKLCLCKKNADGTFTHICELAVCTPTGETITGIKNSIKDIVNGTTVVGKATNATNADKATTADKATNADKATTADKATNADKAATADKATNADKAATADSATKATQDGEGRVIKDTYALKTDIPTVADIIGSKAIGSETNPVYYDGEKFVEASLAPRETTLENSDWELISRIVKSGKAEEYFYLGEEKTVMLTDGTEVKFAIVQFNENAIILAPRGAWYQVFDSYHTTSTFGSISFSLHVNNELSALPTSLLSLTSVISNKATLDYDLYVQKPNTILMSAVKDLLNEGDKTDPSSAKGDPVDILTSQTTYYKIGGTTLYTAKTTDLVQDKIYNTGGNAIGRYSAMFAMFFLEMK